MGQCTSDPKSNSSAHNDYHNVSGKNSSNRRGSGAAAAVASVVTATALKRNSKGSVHEQKRNSKGSVHEQKKLEPMVKIDISDESIYQSDFESDNDYNCGDEELEMPNQRSFKSRRTSSAARISTENLSNRTVQTPAPSIFMVENVVKESGCEAFVINFSDDKPVVKKPRFFEANLPFPDYLTGNYFQAIFVVDPFIQGLSH